MEKITKKVITLYGADMAGAHFTHTYICDVDKLDETLLALQCQCTEYYDYKVVDGWEYDDDERKQLAECTKRHNMEYL